MAYQPYSQSQFNAIRMIIVGLLVLMAYMLYNLTVTIYENYQIDIHISNFEEQNEAIRDENEQKLEDYKYYSSTGYKDKIAKQNFGLVNPGEQVIILTEGDNIRFPESEIILENRERSLASMSNPEKWWHFIFVDNPYKIP